jgi:hypothetical protein
MKKILPKEDVELLAEIRSKLRGEFQRKGRGSQKHLLQALGIKPSTYDAKFREGSLKLTDLVRVLNALDVDPGAFFAGLFPNTGVPPGMPPPAVAQALERLANNVKGGSDD